MTPPRLADRRLHPIWVLAAAGLLAGCSQFAVDGLALRVDHSISIVEPVDRSDATAPLIVRWTDDAPEPGGSYLVLIDRAPMPPGETVRWFSKDDPDCEASSACPDDLYLARRGVTIVNTTSVEIEIVPPLKGARSNSYHEVTVVRLGPDGRRDGETSATTQFELVEP